MKKTLYPSLEQDAVLQVEIERLISASQEAKRVQEPNEAVKALTKAYHLAKLTGEQPRIQQVANALQSAYQLVML